MINWKPKSAFVVYALILFVSCSSEPVPIAFGKDQCTECKMIISDQRFGAEAVTDKGKIRKFDSAECLLDYLDKNPALAHQYLLVIDYENPGALVPAAEAGYLISTDLPSPMGEFISAYKSKVEATSKQETHPGNVYSWNTLRSLNKVRQGQ